MYIKNIKIKMLSFLFILPCVSVLLCGCVHRVVSIDSQPQGAEVYFDRKLIGETPLEHEFLYYGGHHLELVKADYKNLKTIAKLKGPFYEYFPLSFFSELLIPWEITDRHTYNFVLQEGKTKKPVLTPVETPQATLEPAQLEIIEEK